MADVLGRLEPQPLWRLFEGLTRIPRPSGSEGAVAAHVRRIAEDHGFDVRSDAVGNLVVDVPASAGAEAAHPVVLQGHLDMVCEKNRDVTHDFGRDPIHPRVEGDWVTASGTTLGADNGIGVAAALAAATDPAVEHPPLQLLFTVDEETGLTGAKQLDPALIRGRTLLNLDSEEDGVLFVGCAGGTDTVLTFPVTRDDAPAGSEWLAVEVDGLRGGHSGLNIHENRGNAVKLLAHVLLDAVDAGLRLHLATIAGGSKHNAIPREAQASIALPPGERARLASLAECRLAGFRNELSGVDEGVQVRVRDGDAGGRVLSDSHRDRALRLLVGLPHGVLAMSGAIPGLVETSSNLAVVDTTDSSVRIVTSSRSSVAPSLDAVLASIRAVGRLAGAEVDTRDGYPGWKPDLRSPVLGVVRDVYREVWGGEPRVTAIHAGLECGLLGEKVPGIDMVSFGPQIEGAHSPDERVSIPSVASFWTALTRVLGRLARA